jgi:hypothetical protein
MRIYNENYDAFYKMVTDPDKTVVVDGINLIKKYALFLSLFFLFFSFHNSILIAFWLSLI